MDKIKIILKELEEKKDKSIELSKTYIDKSKRAKFRDYAAAYVDAILLIEEIRDEN